MFLNANDRADVERELTALNIHPDEVRRLADLGAAPETRGQEIVMAIAQQRLQHWLTTDIDDARYLTTDCQQQPALTLEATVAQGIASLGPSIYTHLYIGGTALDAPLSLVYIHVNICTEDMRFLAQGPRFLIDGRQLPLPDQLFLQSEGYHIPHDANLTPDFLQEVFRTLQPGGTLSYAPSTNVQDVVQVLQQVGFANVVVAGITRRTTYRGRTTFPTVTMSAQRP